MEHLQTLLDIILAAMLIVAVIRSDLRADAHEKRIEALEGKNPPPKEEEKAK